MFILAMQPQSIGKTLDAGFKLFFSGFKRVFLLALVAAGIGVVPALMMSGMPPAEDAAGIPPGFTGKILGVALLAGVIYMVLNAAILYRLGLAGNPKQSSGSDSLTGSLALGMKTFLPLLFGVILYAVAVVVGSILLIIPGLFLMVSLYLFWPAVVLERLGPVAALKRSHNLVKGNWWRTLTILSVPAFLIMIVYIAVAFVIGVFFAASITAGAEINPENLGQTQLVMQLLEVPFKAAMIPLFAAVMVVLFHDLKLRKEGGDLEARLPGTSSQT